MSDWVCLGMGRILQEFSTSIGEQKRPYQLSEVDDVIAFVLNLEWPTVSRILKIDEKRRSVDLDIHTHERTCAL